jgi:hypothetical protein
MSNIAELERRLDEREEEVQHKRERRQHWTQAVNKKDKAIDEHLEVLHEAREDRNETRGKLVVVRDKIEVVEEDGVLPEEQKRFNRLWLRQDALVDDNEVLTRFIQRELSRIDVLDRQKDHAAHLRREFAEEFEIAVDRRERVQEELRKAKQAAQQSVLGTDKFAVAEFDCNNGARVPQQSYAALRAWVMVIGLPMRNQFGVVFINSGFRTIDYNRAVGGSSMSVHVYNAPWQRSPYAVAVDVHCASGSPLSWYNFTAGKADGRGYYPAGNFHHSDNRNRIGWADATWNGP